MKVSYPSTDREFVSLQPKYISNWQQVHERINRFEILWLVAFLRTKFPKERSLVHKTAISCATQNTKYLNIKHLYLKHFKCLSHTRPHIAHNMKNCPNNQNKNGFIHSIKSSLHFKVSIEFSGNLNNRDRSSVIQMPGSYYLPGEAIVDKLSAIQSPQILD